MTNGDPPDENQGGAASEDSPSPTRVNVVTKSTYRIPYLSDHDPNSRLKRAFIMLLPLYAIYFYTFFVYFMIVGVGSMGAPSGVDTPYEILVVMFASTALIIVSQSWYLVGKPLYLEHNSRHVNEMLLTVLFIILGVLLITWYVVDAEIIPFITIVVNLVVGVIFIISLLIAASQTEEPETTD